MSAKIANSVKSNIPGRPIAKKVLGFTVILLILIGFFTVFLKGKIPTSYFSYSNMGDTLVPIRSSINYDIPKEYDVFYMLILSIGEENTQLDVTVDYGNGSYDRTLDIAPSLSALDFDHFIAHDLDYTYVPIETYGSESVKVTINDMTNTGNLYVLEDSKTNDISFKTACITKAGYGIYLFVSLVILALYVFLCFVDFGKNLSVESIYLTIAIPLTLLFFVLIPTGSSNDVATHIIWTYQQVNSIFGAEEMHEVASTYMQDGDAYIFNNVILDSEQYYVNPTVKQYAEQIKYLKGHRNTGAVSEITRATTGDSANVNIIEYFIPVVVFSFARLVNMNFLLAVNLARLLNALFFMFLVWVSIKIIPYGKEMVMCLGLLPIVIQTMTTINYDYFAYCLTIFGVSIIVRMEQNDFFLSVRDKVFIYLIVIGLASAKGGVYLVPFVMFFAFKCFFEKEGREFIKKNRIYFWGGAVLSAAAMVLANTGAVSARTVVTADINSFSELLHNPGSWVYALAVSISQDMDKLILGIFGNGVGWDEKFFPTWAVMVVIFMFLMCCFREGTEYKKYRTNLWLGPACMFVLILIIYTVFWLSAPRGSVTLYGIQGRYFVPLMIMIGLVFRQFRVKTSFSNSTMSICAYSYVLYYVLNMCHLYLRR